MFQQLASQLLPEDGKEEASRRGPGAVGFGNFFVANTPPKFFRMEPKNDFLYESRNLLF